MIVGPLKDARSFSWFLELPPGDVCPREKTSEEPSGDKSWRGGIYVEERKDRLTTLRHQSIKVCKESQQSDGFLCFSIGYFLFLVPANQKFVEGTPLVNAKTPEKF